MSGEEGSIDPQSVLKAMQIIAGGSAGSIPLHEACSRLVGIYHSLGDVPLDALDVIRAVDSELDGIPSEAQRKFWNPEAFEREVRKRDEYLARMKKQILASFLRLKAYLILIRAGGYTERRSTPPHGRQ